MPNLRGRNAKNHGDDDADLEGGMLVSKRRWISPAQLNTRWGDEYHHLRNQRKTNSSAFEEKKDAIFLRRRHDCWIHCDFPSECHHAMYRAQREGRPVMKRATDVDEAYIALKKVERVTGLVSVLEDEDGDGSSSASSSPPPPAWTADDKSEEIRIVIEEEVSAPSVEGEYLGSEDLQTRMDSDSGMSTATCLYKGKDTETGTDLPGDKGYESFKRLFRSSVPMALHLDSRDGTSRRQGRAESPPLSPFSLSKRTANIAEAVDNSRRNPAVPVETNPDARDENEDCVVQTATSSEPRDAAANDNANAVYGYENGEDAAGDDRSLDRLLHALFQDSQKQKTAPACHTRRHRCQAKKVQHTSLSPASPFQQGTRTRPDFAQGEGMSGNATKGLRQVQDLTSFGIFEDSTVAAAESLPSLSLVVEGGRDGGDDHEDGDDRDFVMDDIAEETLLAQAYGNDEAWLFPGANPSPQEVGQDGSFYQDAVPSEHDKEMLAATLGKEQEEEQGEGEERERVLTPPGRRTNFSQPRPPNTHSQPPCRLDLTSSIVGSHTQGEHGVETSWLDLE